VKVGGGLSICVARMHARVRCTKSRSWLRIMSLFWAVNGGESRRFAFLPPRWVQYAVEAEIESSGKPGGSREHHNQERVP
jgi:hypothetical protein